MNMKTKRVIHIAVLICAAVTVSGSLAYRQSRSSGHQRINVESNLKKIGMPYRMGRNDFRVVESQWQLSLTGSVVAPKIQADER
jgi:hypothetical protein